MSAKAQTRTSQIMAGRYKVERLIARGGMGSVYLAQQLDLNRMVALKVLSPSPDHEEGGSFEDRFRLEAETLAALNHQNIVTIYDYGQTDDGRFFLALEYIDGPRFTDLLRDGPLPVERAVRLILQVAKALRYAHKRGVVHRDLKPSNLLVRRDDEGEEQVKVVDFGLVKVLEEDQSLTRAGLILGSPHCMAPEQIRGEDIDHRADIYALGILLFRSITGKWPFHGESGTATMIAHINNMVPTFAEVRPDLQVPPGLEDVVRRCLAKAPADRYPDVVILMGDLKRVVGIEAGATTTGTALTGITPSLPTPPALNRRRRRVSPWLPAAAVGLVAFLLGVVVIMAWHIGRRAASHVADRPGTGDVEEGLVLPPGADAEMPDELPFAPATEVLATEGDEGGDGDGSDGDGSDGDGSNDDGSDGDGSNDGGAGSDDGQATEPAQPTAAPAAARPPAGTPATKPAATPPPKPAGGTDDKKNGTTEDTTPEGYMPNPFAQ